MFVDDGLSPSRPHAQQSTVRDQRAGLLEPLCSYADVIPLHRTHGPQLIGEVAVQVIDIVGNDDRQQVMGSAHGDHRGDLGMCEKLFGGTRQIAGATAIQIRAWTPKPNRSVSTSTS